MRNNVRLLFILIIFAVANVGWGQNRPELTAGLKELEKLKKEFVAKKTIAKKEVLDAFQTQIDSLKKDASLTETQRIDATTLLTKEKDDFAANDELELRDMLVKTGFEYGIKVNELYQPVTKKYNDLLKIATKANDSTALKSIQDNKADFEAIHLKGRYELVEKSTWNGKRVHAHGGTNPFRIIVSEMTGEVFTGRIGYNVSASNHPVDQMAGTVDGIQIKMKNVKAIKGKLSPKQMVGVLLGNTMIVRIEETDDGPKKKPQTVVSYAFLRKIRANK